MFLFLLENGFWVNLADFPLYFEPYQLYNQIFTIFLCIFQDNDYLGIGLEEGHLKLVWNFHEHFDFDRRKTLISKNHRILDKIVTNFGVLADAEWHKLILSIGKMNLTLIVDEIIYTDEPAIANIKYDEVHLYIGMYNT